MISVTFDYYFPPSFVTQSTRAPAIWASPGDLENHLHFAKPCSWLLRRDFFTFQLRVNWIELFTSVPDGSRHICLLQHFRYVVSQQKEEGEGLLSLNLEVPLMVLPCALAAQSSEVVSRPVPLRSDGLFADPTIAIVLFSDLTLFVCGSFFCCVIVSCVRQSSQGSFTARKMRTV